MHLKEFKKRNILEIIKKKVYRKRERETPVHLKTSLKIHFFFVCFKKKKNSTDKCLLQNAFYRKD